MPQGDEFDRWSRLTRVGKIAWFWSALNGAMLDQASRLPPDAAMLQKLEDLDFPAYRRLMDFLGAPANLTEADYAGVRRRRPNASSVERGPRDWSDAERSEFESEVRVMAERLGYEWRVERLTLQSSSHGPPGGSLRRMASRWRPTAVS
jgi:hypothetical protein